MDSTQYLIDIATKLSGTKDAASALVDLGQRMVETGANATQMDAALVAAKAQLEQAAASAKSASDAFSAGSSAYSASEAGADRAAKAAEKLGQDLEQARARMAAMQAAAGGTELGAPYEAAAAKVQDLASRHEAAQAKAAALQAALAGEAAALDQLKTAADAAKDAHQQLAAGTDVLEQGVKKAARAEEDATKAASGSGQVNELAEAFGKLGGPVGAAGQKLLGFADGLKKMAGGAGSGLGAVLGLTVAVVAIAAALGYAIVKTAMWAVGLADAARNAALTNAALEKSKPALEGVGKTIAQVHGQTGLAVDQLQGLAKQLADAGVSAKDMPSALQAVALAESALGQGAAGKLVEDLKSGKKSASELAAEMQSKFGGIVAKKMLSLDAQALKLKENLGETFGGLNIEGLLGGLSKLVAMLGQSSAFGRALKFVFESLFQPLIDGAVAAIPKVQLFFLGLAIGAFKAYNAVKPAIRVVRELAGAGEGKSWDWLAVGKIAAYSLAVAFGLLAVAVLIAAAPFIVLGLAIYSIVAYAQQAGSELEAFRDRVSSALGFDLTGVGSGVVEGFINGMLGGIPGAIAAAVNLAQSAIGAAKAALDSHSPSRAFAELGGYTSEGYAQGVEDGAPDARTALERMVAPPDTSGGAKAAGEGAAAGAGSAAGTGGPVTFQAGAIVVHGGGDNADEIAAAVKQAILDLFERGRGAATAGA